MMLAATYGTVSDTEIIWTMIATVGFSLSVYNVRHAYRDMRNTRNVRNGRRSIAVSTFRLETSRIVIQSIFIALGVLAMLVPEPSDAIHQPLRYLLLGIVFRWGLLTAATLITFQSWTNRELRRRLLEDIEQNEVEAQRLLT